MHSSNEQLSEWLPEFEIRPSPQLNTFPVISRISMGSLTTIPVFFESLPFLEMVDFMTLLCVKENAFVKTRIFSCLMAEVAQGTYNILQCCMLKPENDKGLSTTRCLSAAFTVCSLHSHDWYLSSLHGNVANEKSEKIPPHLQLGRCWRDLRTTSKTSGFFHLHRRYCCSPLQRCLLFPSFPACEFVEFVAVQQLGVQFFHLNSWKAWRWRPLARELFRPGCVWLSNFVTGNGSLSLCFWTDIWWTWFEWLEI